MSRRLFLAAGISRSAVPAPPPNQKSAWAFATAEGEVRMTVEFYDRYSSSGFSFRDVSAGRAFCLSAAGEQDRDCAAGFAGSLAIARYTLRPNSAARRMIALREHVRTIDQDARLLHRPPFDRTLEFRDGVASDIQAFGYETARAPETGGPWRYFRQDLYLVGRPAAFLVLHWRHTLSAIRILDLIPGDGTWLIQQ